MDEMNNEKIKRLFDILYGQLPDNDEDKQFIEKFKFRGPLRDYYASAYSYHEFCDQMAKQDYDPTKDFRFENYHEKQDYSDEEWEKLKDDCIRRNEDGTCRID